MKKYTITPKRPAGLVGTVFFAIIALVFVLSGVWPIGAFFGLFATLSFIVFLKPDWFGSEIKEKE